MLLIEIVILVDMAPRRDFKARCKTGDVDFEFKPLYCIQGGFQKDPIPVSTTIFEGVSMVKLSSRASWLNLVTTPKGHMGKGYDEIYAELKDSIRKSGIAVEVTAEAEDAAVRCLATNGRDMVDLGDADSFDASSHKSLGGAGGAEGEADVDGNDDFTAFNRQLAFVPNHRSHRS